MKNFCYTLATQLLWKVSLVSCLVLPISCNDPHRSEITPSSEEIMMRVSFKSETVRFSKLAEHVDATSLSEDASHFVSTRGVPSVTSEKQVFTIFKDGQYELVIEKLNPKNNPAREAFRQETQMQDWELQRLVIKPGSIIGYDVSGAVIFNQDNSQNPYFNRLIAKIKSDPYFASHVNIGNALFKVSAGAINYTDPELRKFFLDPDVTYERQGSFMIIRQNTAAIMRHWGGNIALPSPASRKGNPSGRQHDEEASYSPEETTDMINEEIDGILSQRNPNDILVMTAIDTVTSSINAEVIMSAEGQVLSTTSYVSANDAQQTMQVAYTETFETDPVHDVDLLNVESVTFSEVEVINNL